MKPTLVVVAVVILAHAGAGEASGAERVAPALVNPMGPDRAVSAPGVLSAPLAWLGAALSLPFHGSRELPNSRALEPGDGWTDLVFPVGEQAQGLYVEIRGRVEFDRAEIRFTDGSLRSVDLAGAVRTRGLFELVAFERSIAVAELHVRARAQAPATRMGVRLGR